MLKYEMDEKEVRQQVTKRGKKEKKRKFSPQSLTIKIIKSSKVTKKERKKEKRIYLLKVWNMIRPKAEREKERKEDKIKEKEKRERKKEKRNCLPLWWKLRRTKKGKGKNSSKREEERG